MAEVGDVICGLDIGTTKVAAIIGEVTPGGVEILGVGTSPSDGLRQGVVVNIEATTSSIQAAVQEAEQMAAADVSAVFVGIAGGRETDVRITLTAYPSITDFGRVRFDFDARASREIVNDFTISLIFFDTYDSRPAAAGAAKNDFGASVALGWKF